MNSKDNTEITHITWGTIEVTIEGRTHRFKDCKVWPDGAAEWEWNETGTRHQPGIQPVDLEEILAHDIEVIILSRGMAGRLRIHPETEQMLNSQGMEYHIEKTQRAVKMFNEFMKRGKKVGGIFHSTC
ncbi:MAG: Mth938-like domain-containing protein [Desulfobacterales bacterium]